MKAPEKPHEITRGKFIKWAYRVTGYKIAKLLALTPIHPNTVTWSRFFIVVVASILLAHTDYHFRVAGVILLQLFSILDKTDGGLARMKGIESKYGAWLDSNFDVIGIATALGAVWYSTEEYSKPTAIMTMFSLFFFVLLKLNRLKRTLVLSETQKQVTILGEDEKNQSPASPRTLMSVASFFFRHFSIGGRTMVLMISLGVLLKLQALSLFVIFGLTMLTWLGLFVSTIRKLHHTAD